MDALKEIARVLKPVGVFGMIWNIDDCMHGAESCYCRSKCRLTRHEKTDNAPRSWKIHDGWETVMRDVIWTFDDDSPRFRHEKWRQVFDEQTASNPVSLQLSDPLFSLPLGEGAVDFQTWLSKDAIWSRLRTLSQLAVLEGEELDKVKKTFDDSMDMESNKVDEAGRVAVHGRTVFFWTSKIPSEPLRSGG